MARFRTTLVRHRARAKECRIGMGERRALTEAVAFEGSLDYYVKRPTGARRGAQRWGGAVDVVDVASLRRVS